MWVLVTFIAAWLGGVAAQPPTGAISGRIVDEKGNPVADAEVSALKAEYLPGGRRLRGVNATRTDARGDFRLGPLPVGKYYVTASGPRQVRGAAFAPTFYPGTASATDALRVDVRDRQDTVAIEFALMSVRLARIAGFVLDSTAKPAVDQVVLLNPSRTDGAMVLKFDGNNIVEAQPDGSFAFTNIAPGEYRVDALPKAGLEAVAKSGRSGLPQTLDLEYASVPVTVNGEDIPALKIATKAGRRLSGRITVEAASAEPDVLSRITVSTYDPRFGTALSGALFLAGSDVAPDGTFTIRGASGLRLVRVYGLPRGWALKSVRWSGADVTDSGIEVADSDVTDVEVFVTAAPAGITGVALDALSRPVAGSTVVVFPTDLERRANPPNRYLAHARTAADGTFTISPLPAGEYFVAVLSEFVDGEWAEPDNLEQLESRAVKVKLGEGERKRMTLRR